MENETVISCCAISVCLRQRQGVVEFSRLTDIFGQFLLNCSLQTSLFHLKWLNVSIGLAHLTAGKFQDQCKKSNRARKPIKCYNNIVVLLLLLLYPAFHLTATRRSSQCFTASFSFTHRLFALSSNNCCERCWNVVRKRAAHKHTSDAQPKLQITARIEGACGALSHILLDYYNTILHIATCAHLSGNDKFYWQLQRIWRCSCGRIFF